MLVPRRLPPLPPRCRTRRLASLLRCGGFSQLGGEAARALGRCALLASRLHLLLPPLPLEWGHAGANTPADSGACVCVSEGARPRGLPSGPQTALTAQAGAC